MASASPKAFERGINVNFPKKVCTRCGLSKPLCSFPPRCSRASGYQSQCRSCKAAWRKTEAAKKSKLVSNYRHRAANVDKMRAYYLKRNYGLSMDQYGSLSEQQGHVCKICGGTDPSRYRRLMVDHCHATGRIRGLLCGPCNRALGVLGDTAEAIQKVLEYLRSEPPL